MVPKQLSDQYASTSPMTVAVRELAVVGFSLWSSVATGEESELQGRERPEQRGWRRSSPTGFRSTLLL